eukprot:SAG22_NODE_306_length_12671_cov_14.743239_8_plen_330_part_00
MSEASHCHAYMYYVQYHCMQHNVMNRVIRLSATPEHKHETTSTKQHTADRQTGRQTARRMATHYRVAKTGAVVREEFCLDSSFDRRAKVRATVNELIRGVEKQDARERREAMRKQAQEERWDAAKKLLEVERLHAAGSAATADTLDEVQPEPARFAGFSTIGAPAPSALPLPLFLKSAVDCPSSADAADDGAAPAAAPLTLNRMEECPVCYDALDRSKPGFVVTNCGHTFCMNCFVTLLRQSRNQTCPMCRESLEPPPRERAGEQASRRRTSSPAARAGGGGSDPMIAPRAAASDVAVPPPASASSRQAASFGYYGLTNKWLADPAHHI